MKIFLDFATTWIFLIDFYLYYLRAPRPTMGHWRGDSLTHPILIAALYQVWPEGHREPRNEVESHKPVPAHWLNQNLLILSLTRYATVSFSSL